MRTTSKACRSNPDQVLCTPYNKTDLLEEYYTKAARHIQTPASKERSYTIQRELPKQKRGNLDTDPNCKRIRQTAKQISRRTHEKKRLGQQRLGLGFYQIKRDTATVAR